MDPALRDYATADEQSWLRCRVLAFLATAYFDDVHTARAPIAEPGFGLVAVADDGTVVGILDVTVEDALATIDTVAVHPDHRHRGIGRALLTRALGRVAEVGATALDAWTRDDQATLEWYRAMGFAESDHYLHVYANHYTDPAEPDRAMGGRRPGLRPVAVFLHAELADEQRWRREFARVHVCRRCTLTL
jgi:ribosomal protein S18 acetylase RimI-like enzyme